MPDALIRETLTSPRSLEISDALRQQQLRMFKADKRLREQEGIEPGRSKRRKK